MTTDVRSAVPHPLAAGTAAARLPGAVGQAVTIALWSLRLRWRSLLVWSAGVAGITAVQLAVYPSVASSAEGMKQMLQQWPAGLQEAFHLDAYGTGPGFLNAELFSMVVPLVLVAVALGAAAAATAGEEERGTADLLLSLPVSRTVVLLGKLLALVLGVLVVAVATVVTIVVGAPVVDLEVSTVHVVAAVGMTVLLALLLGAFGLLVGVLTGHRAAVLGGGIGLALAAFLLNALAPMADWLEPWQDLSPFAWALGDDPLTTGMSWPDAALLVGLTVLLVVLAAVLYRRRDVASR